ncbi:MAG: hypothetical protein JWQ01_3989 [Massilia sp.]|jgi:hypothetical protein|nr:hypothetical protein [Massilia sp.]
MSRTSSVWKILLLGMLAHVSLAQAQQTVNMPPPKMERVDDSDTPITTAPPRTAAPKVTERRENGQVKEVEVHSGKSTYTMRANPPTAVAQPGDQASGTLRPPQWKVLEFDLFRKKQKEEADAAGAATAVAPPPPPLPGK